MPLEHPALLSETYLRSEFEGELETFVGSHEEVALLTRLRHWSERDAQKETSAENAFVDLFFKQTWGYAGAGELPAELGYTCYPKFPVSRAGATGSTGQADLALGVFGHPSLPPIPQVLCEFKDIRSGLDTAQRRKHDTRTPVQQCISYLREAVASLTGNEPVQPHWGIVTDMNEFRLYRRTTMPTQYQRFVLKPAPGDSAISLLAEGRQASFQRLLFCRLFHADRLVSAGGEPLLIRDLKRQFTNERKIEQEFYAEYRAYREHLIDVLTSYNPRFPGTKGRLVRLAQTILDRCIFVLFCEDMGRSLSFPPALLRDYLVHQSTDPYYEPQGEEIWAKLRQLFSVMNAGGLFLNHSINRFNGGLFAHDAELENLRVPNGIFCQPNQGASSEQLRSFPRTLLYFSAEYNFGPAAEGRAVTLYTLGRIFEQSITELEALEADADKRPSLTKIAKRKRDGVYYTPEAIVEKVVEGTVGARLAQLRQEAGLDETIVFTDTELLNGADSVKRQIAAFDTYRDLLQSITVVDPACGSGAFLIHALEYLLRERRGIGLARERLAQSGGLLFFDPEEQIRDILSRNIYGVDINPASVEIARLALWLHTARADRPLCDLDRNVITGNSLIAPSDLTAWRPQMALIEIRDQERINAFDWASAFPEVFARGGFDCVIGNPPYVKLQNFRKVQPDVAEFLNEAVGSDGKPLYQSTQAGNFDLFLPFIEKGIGLLHPQGRMGYIAPSLWRLNEYGEPLRRFLYTGRHLDRWLDFKSHQVFEEATTYTALQFFTRSPNQAVRFADAPNGELDATWDDPIRTIPYQEAELAPATDTWVFLPEPERRLVQRLSRDCKRLDDLSTIIVGIQTSADSIYHLRRIRPGVYESRASKNNPVEVSIEDSIMHPLVSGPEVDRYGTLATDTYLLFPYNVVGNNVALITQGELKRTYPDAWRYLNNHEGVLRARERKSFDDERWYRLGRHQNLDKNALPKLVVPRLLLSLSCAIDSFGKIYLDNVDVGGILCQQKFDLYFIAAVLNAPVANFIWRRISKPFQNDYRSANKQFIAPLPIPNASREEKRHIAAQALQLTRRHGRLKHLHAEIERRLEQCTPEKRGEDWLLPAVGSLENWKGQAPKSLKGHARTTWAKAQREAKLAEQTDLLATRLAGTGPLRSGFAAGELLITRGEQTILNKIFVSSEEGPFLEGQWQLALWDVGPRPITATRLIDTLRCVRTTENAALRSQVVGLLAQARHLRTTIDDTESSLNNILFDLYRLTQEERAMVLAP